jgi:hypothetical protein
VDFVVVDVAVGNEVRRSVLAASRVMDVVVEF